VSENRPNIGELFGKAEFWLVRCAVFIIFMVGLYKVMAETLTKLLK
jgi:hypothetical protein